MKLLSPGVEVTRSLSSNLIKYNFVNFEKEEKKIIDNDARLPLFKPINLVKEENRTIDNQSDIAPSNGSEFSFGIKTINVDDIIREKEEQLSEKANKILADASEKAKQIIEEARMQMELERQSVMEQANSQGFKQGYNDGQAEISKLQEELKDQIEQNALDYQRTLQDLEPRYTELTIKLLQKLTGVIATEQKSVIMHLIHEALSDSDNSERYIIHVSREDKDFVKQKLDSIKDLIKENAVVEILIDSKLERNQCFIETDTSVIDCSLDMQLDSLITDLRILAGI
ncbi:MAG TPA: FliH/SctL family protein [Lachnospiraceae bacterium]|nr:FliH/SctL family protein [Lachnospiraceae bacterium]